MSWFGKQKWQPELDARCEALVARAKRPGHDNSVTVRWVQPTKPAKKKRAR